MTDGLDVLVQLVIEAMTTWPWSISTSAPSMTAFAGLEARSPLVRGSECEGRPALSDASSASWLGASEAGKVLASSVSTEDFSMPLPSTT